jgi:hypothetical protein
VKYGVLVIYEQKERINESRTERERRKATRK